MRPACEQELRSKLALGEDLRLI